MKKEFGIVIAAVILLSVLTIVPIMSGEIETNSIQEEVNTNVVEIDSQVIAGNEICFQDSAYSSIDFSSMWDCPNSVIMKEKTISPSDKFEISYSSITSAECKKFGMIGDMRRVEIEYEYCIRALPTCPPETYNLTFSVV